jgi:CBS domain-containing protein
VRRDRLRIEVSERELVDGFSRSKIFDSEVVSAAEDCGIFHACSMLVIYNFTYVPVVEAAVNAPIKFVGVVPFPGFG